MAQHFLQVAISTVLRNDVDVVLCFDEVNKFHDVGVTKSF